MRIQEIKERYRDEWVLLEVITVNNKGDLLEGNVLAHSKNRNDTYQNLKKSKVKDIAHFYTGEIPNEGYAVAFIWESTSLIKKKT